MEDTALGNDSTSTTAPDAIGIIESEDFSGRDDSFNKDVEEANGGEDADVVDESDNDNENDKPFTTVGEEGVRDAPIMVNRSLSSESKKRSSEDDSVDDDEPLPTLPLKRARTAYFIFADEKRDEVKQQVWCSKPFFLSSCCYIILMLLFLLHPLTCFQNE